MDIQINKIKIFRDNLSTLKQTSLDDNGDCKESMISSDTEVVDFDGVKNDYIKDLKLTKTPSSSDALFEDQKGQFYLVEFKNGHIDHKVAHSIRKKIYDSLLIFHDLTKTNISFGREHMNFILVYNKEKNPCSRDPFADAEDGPTPSRVAIGDYFSKKAKTHFIRFDLEQFKTIYFQDIFTFSKEEFLNFPKN